MKSGWIPPATGRSTRSCDPKHAAAASTRARTSESASAVQATPARRVSSSASPAESPGASASIIATQPATSFAIGPTWSKLGASGNTPSAETSP